MAAIRTVSTAVRRISGCGSSKLGRRGYAQVSDKLKFSFVLPHQALFTDKEVIQVNVPAEAGDMGVLANHVPSIEALRPGVVEVIQSTGDSQKFFVSGGFATVHPNNRLTINVIEGAPLETFSKEAVRSNLQEALKVASGSGTDVEKTEARIEADVYEALQHALDK